ncbi:MAG TPA: VWA domain-containing protein, partial [Nannocystis sp.]
MLLGACLDHPLKAVEYDKSEEAENTVAIAINKDVDILFVIDNSGSMGEEQQLLSENFASFINVLEAKDVQANYRIGITTTDAGNPRCPTATYKPEGGNLVLSSCLDRIEQNEFKFGEDDFSAACTSKCTKRDADLTVRGTTTAYDMNEVPRKWIERIETESNIQGVDSNVEAFQCYGPQGVAGCGFESHLESMYLALANATSSASKNNYGFLREAAILSIVFITDEADCSYNPLTKEIFTTNKVFWKSPDDPAPTSSLCWKAGVECTGGPGTYSECHSQNYDVTGAVTTDPTKMALQPVSKYIDFVKSIEAEKQLIDESQNVLVSLIAGVPKGYEDLQAEIPYEDSADTMLQGNFGIGPGCVLDAGTA